MEERHYKVIFQPSGRRGEIQEGTSLLEAARELGVDIETVCGEKQTCGKCKVEIQEGAFDREGIESSMSHLTDVAADELKFIREKDPKNTRLACMARVHGDILAFVPEKSRAGNQVVRKAATERPVAIKPAVRRYYIELQKPTLTDPLGEWERLSEALAKVYGLEGLTIDYATLKELPRALRAADWKATVTIWQGKEVQRVEPGFTDLVVGIAVDIGTTTVAGYLTDLTTGKVLATHSMMNPQVSFGEDVMSRITFAQTQEDGLARMHASIIEGLNSLFQALVQEAHLTLDDVAEVILVANTAMHHILLDLDPTFLGRSPFPPVIHHSVDVKARDMGLNVRPSTNIHVLPNEAGFVGADNVGVLVAEEPQNQDEMLLIIDIGTNGELVMGNRHKLISTSCATGPAFEGAHIKFGMRAAPGAIEKVHIDPVTYEVEYQMIAPTRHRKRDGELKVKGICGSGIIDAVAEMFRVGILKKSGKFDMDRKTLRLRKGEGEPEFILAWANETSIGQDVTVSQSDVRALQLAKGALYAGAWIMMRRLGVQQVDKVILAGAFGSYIDKEKSLLLGLFPDVPLDKVYAVGNAAGDGARMALLNTDKRREADVVARQVEYVELTVEEDFDRVFMEAMYFPHMKHPFPHAVEILNGENKGGAVGA